MRITQISQSQRITQISQSHFQANPCITLLHAKWHKDRGRIDLEVIRYKYNSISVLCSSEWELKLYFYLLKIVRFVWNLDEDYRGLSNTPKWLNVCLHTHHLAQAYGGSHLVFLLAKSLMISRIS